MVLFDVNNRIFGPYLAANSRMLIQLRFLTHVPAPGVLRRRSRGCQ
jgi:hypothetical protein